MKKKANKDFPVHEFIDKRWSPRAFADKPVEEEKINSLFEAARWAASSRNSQPWRFIYASKDNKKTYDKLFQVMGEWNQSWAKTAPLLILTITETHDEKNRPLGHSLYDLGLALGNLTTQATSAGIYLHHMGGIEPDVAKNLFNIPDRYEAITMIAAGYPGSSSVLSADIAETEYDAQKRISQKDFVFRESFGR